MHNDATRSCNGGPPPKFIVNRGKLMQYKVVTNHTNTNCLKISLQCLRTIIEIERKRATEREKEPSLKISCMN